jgi:hypothetical protein
VALERLTLGSPPLEGIVLRYGQIYGPGTTSDAPSGDAPLHVDAGPMPLFSRSTEGRRESTTSRKTPVSFRSKKRGESSAGRLAFVWGSDKLAVSAAFEL